MSAAAKTKTPKAPPALPHGYRIIDEALWVAADHLGCETAPGLGVYLSAKSPEDLAAIGLERAVDMDGSLHIAPEPSPQASPPGAGEGVTRVEVDGFLVDPETGEVLGPVVEPGFVVDCPERLEWVLRRIGEVEAQFASIEQTDAVIHARAVLANAERLKADHQRRLDSLHYRFDAEVEHYVRGALAGEKTKTLKTLFGSVSLRTVPGRVSIADPALAAKTLAEEYPAALDLTVSLAKLGEGLDADIARRALLDLAGEAGDAAKLAAKISSVPTGLQAELAARQETGFVRTEARESMSIDTGVK